MNSDSAFKLISDFIMFVLKWIFIGTCLYLGYRLGVYLT